MHRVTIGVDAQRLSDARKNWANCNAVATANANCPTVGVEKGVLQLDQREIVTSLGPYVREELDLGAWRATLGLRHDDTRFELRDAYLADGRNDSGNRTMRAWSPMGALSFRVTPDLAWYASVTSAFETPTTTELGNNADGSAGLNRTLAPQYSTTMEMGAKGIALSNGRWRYDLAIYRTAVRDELIPFDIGSGRTAYRNAGRTRRRGVEVSSDGDVGPVTLALAFTFSDFRFGDYRVGTAQYAGNSIPGVPERQVQTSATWHLPNAFVVAEWMAKSAVIVSDANTAFAPAYAVTNLRIGGTTPKRPWIAPVFGVSNLFDRKHVASVAVNAAAGKFYEPGTGRMWFVGLSAASAK
jgi:iron complex outermembrane receptor protein